MTTDELGKVTTEVDADNRLYSQAGILIHSKINITDSSRTSAYSVETNVDTTDPSAINTLGQITKMTVITVDDGKTTIEKDNASRAFDAKGRLIWSDVTMTETTSTSITPLSWDVTGDQITSNAHSLTNGDAVVISGTALTGGLKANTTYYVEVTGVNTFKLHKMSDRSDAAVDIAAGTTGLTYRWANKYNVNSDITGFFTIGNTITIGGSGYNNLNQVYADVQDDSRRHKDYNRD